ncbi:hypothetical protein STEG23_013394 [Scotinomys teguina]
MWGDRCDKIGWRRKRKDMGRGKEKWNAVNHREHGTKQTFLENMDGAENLTASSASNNICHDTIDEFRNQVYSTMYSMISVVGFFGNGFVLYVLIKTYHEKSAFQVYMINLAIADLLCAEMGRHQCKSTYNNIKNKTSPKSSPPPTPRPEHCNVDKAEENDLKNSLMKMIEEALEGKMKNAIKQIEEKTNKKLEENNKEIEEKNKKIKEMNKEIEDKKKEMEEIYKEVEKTNKTGGNQQRN